MISKKLRRVWILGFAGHRSLTDEAAIRQSIRTAVETFRSQVDGEVIGRSSAADGADLLFLEACRDAGLSYSVVLPFPEDRFREDFADDTRWARAKSIIDGAASVEIAPGHEGAPEAYHLAAREILDVADAMLFVWDGQPARGLGGTAETVGDARDRGLPHQIIDAASGNAGPFVNAPVWPWADAAFESLPPAGGVEELFEALDHRALNGAPKSRLLAAGSISLNQIATLIFGVLVAFGIAAGPASVVKFLLVTAAAILPWASSRKRIHGRWLNDRVRAELLRSLLVSHSFAPPLRPFAADLFLTDAAFLRSASWKLAGRSLPWNEEQSRYMNGRLDDQIRYLESKAAKAAKRLSLLDKITKISGLGAMVLSAAAILNALCSWNAGGWVDSIVLTFLPTILPAVAAWSLSMIALFEHKRRAGLYRQMVERLGAKRVELAHAKCRVTAAAVVSSCERLLLTELWEWGDSGGKRR